jgi:hypothetical protein
MNILFAMEETMINYPHKYLFMRIPIIWGLPMMLLLACDCTGHKSDYYSKDLGGGRYCYVSDWSGHYLESYKNCVWPEVSDYSWNEAFIVAAQHPKYETAKYFLYSEMRINGDKRIDERTYTDVDQRERFIDSIAKTDPYYAKIFSGKVNYWIIEIKNDRIYGPLSKEEYVKVRQDLRIPKNVKLKTEFE